MVLRYPAAAITDFAPLLVYSAKGAKVHYGNRYEVELDNGPQNWISEDVHTANGSPIYHCRLSVIQTFLRETGKTWNHVDPDSYNLRSILPANSDTELPPATSRDFLKWAIYAALGLKQVHPQTEVDLELFSENRAYRQFRPIVFTNSQYTSQGVPLFILEAWIPQQVTREEGFGWKHVDEAALPESELTVVPSLFSSPD